MTNPYSIHETQTFAKMWDEIGFIYQNLPPNEQSAIRDHNFGQAPEFPGFSDRETGYRSTIGYLKDSFPDLKRRSLRDSLYAQRRMIKKRNEIHPIIGMDHIIEILEAGWNGTEELPNPTSPTDGVVIAAPLTRKRTPW